MSNVIGVISNTSTVLGVSADGISYTCSYDGGFEWDLCVGEEVNSIQTDPNFISAKNIPITDLSGLSYAALKTNYGFTFGSIDISGKLT